MDTLQTLKMHRRTGYAALGAVGVIASLVLIAGDRLYVGAPAKAAASLADFESYPPGAICHSPARASATASMVLLASTQGPQGEVSPMGRAAPVSPDLYVASAPPLWDNLGDVTYKVSTANPEAQAYFDQGLRLAYAFNHVEAQRAFRQAQTLDPECAMCFWGEALVLGPHVNMPMLSDSAAPAWAALTRAQALAVRATPREQALIHALAARYQENPPADRSGLDKAYAEAMGKVAAEYPDDLEIATLYAEAVMDVSPWDYWEPGGVEPHAHSRPIVPTLERVLARDPNHPGAIHLYIHAVEASDRPERAEPYADRLRGAVPGAGHLVHMPSHIYYRVGRYDDALDVNQDAAAADEAYLAETNAPAGVYSLGYYPHNVHFLIATAQMVGDGATVIAAAEKLTTLIPDEAARTIALVQPVKAAPYFAHAQFSAPATVLALPDPGNAVPYVKAMWHYARGVAQVDQGNYDAARTEADAIEAIDGNADWSLLTAAGIPGSDVLDIAVHTIHARIAQANGDYDSAIARFEQAAALQDGLPYMEPPYWYYPVRQSLGAALVQAGRYDEAAEQFRLSLVRAPNNAWSYYGLFELHKARGDIGAMAAAEDVLNQNWVGDRQLLRLSNL